MRLCVKLFLLHFHCKSFWCLISSISPNLYAFWRSAMGYEITLSVPPHMTINREESSILGFASTYRRESTNWSTTAWSYFNQLFACTCSCHLISIVWEFGVSFASMLPSLSIFAQRGTRFPSLSLWMLNVICRAIFWQPVVKCPLENKSRQNLHKDNLAED